MLPLEASTILATLVGLLCNWKQERGAVAQDRFQDFITWLTQHHFNALRDKIEGSAELQREMGQLLREDSQILSGKLDLVCEGISSLSQRIESLSGVANALESKGDSLSEQAIEILKLFSESGANRMVTFDPHPGMENILLLPNRVSYSLSDVRFMEYDLCVLCRFDFIRQVDSTTQGNPIYGLTRNGAAFAAQLCGEPEQQPESRTPQPVMTLI